MPAPRNVVAGRITQRRRTGHANAHSINERVMQVDIADRSSVGGSGGLKCDLRLQVWIGIGRQGMEGLRVVTGRSAGGEELRAGRKAVHVCVSGKGANKSCVSDSCGSSGGRRDAAGLGRRGAAGECPNSLGIVALEGIDGENQLRLALLQRTQKSRKRRDNQRRYKAAIIGPMLTKMFS